MLLLLGLILLFGWIDWAGLASWVRPRAPWLAAFASAAAVAARSWWSTPEEPARERAPGLSWWTVVAAGVVVGAVAWGATSWLVSEADRATTADAKAAAKVDAIKTGLGIGAGTTGVFALLLAVRRQTHQERTAADTLHDATERRVTELYTKAADQLGSPKAAVRLAGLYALERLGEDHERQRPTIVDLLCAYLRMRYAEPVAPEDKASSEAVDRYENHLQEAQVRQAGQRILHRHSQPFLAGDGEVVSSYWATANLMTLDLRGANLAGATFSRADLSFADLDGAVLDHADLSHVDFEGASLVGTSLVGANLRRARFGGHMPFQLPGESSAVLRDANLRGATLENANLEYVDLAGADLTDADLTNTSLTGAMVSDATRIALPAGYRIRKCVILPAQELDAAPTDDAEPA